MDPLLVQPALALLEELKKTATSTSHTTPTPTQIYPTVTRPPPGTTTTSSPNWPTISSDLSTSTIGIPHPTPTAPPYPLPVFEAIRSGSAGHVILWLTFVIMLVGAVYIGYSSRRHEARLRIFHYLSLVVLLVASISYYAMASLQTSVFVPTRASGGHAGYTIRTFRQVFWARYVDWAITTPLLLLNLGLLAGFSPVMTLAAMIAGEGMILTGMFSALSTKWGTRWGYYVFACLFLLNILIVLLYEGRHIASARPRTVASLYTKLSILIVLVWIAYPIVFALSEGSNLIPVSAQVIIYAVLDILAKPAFAAWLVTARRKSEETANGTDQDICVLPEGWVGPRRGYERVAGEAEAASADD